MNDQLSKIVSLGVINDWALLPLKEELSKIEPVIKAECCPSSHLKKGCKNPKYDLNPELITYLLKRPSFDFSLPLGLISEGPSSLCLLGAQELSDEVKHFISAKVAGLNQLFSQANLLGSSQLGYSVEHVLEGLADLERNLPTPGGVPRLQGKREYYLGFAAARLVYRLIFGPQSYDLDNPAEGSAFDLLAGNDALTRRGAYPEILDITKLWWEMTNLPLVLMIWQKQEKTAVPPAVKAKILKAANLAQTKMKVEPSSYLPDIRPVDAKGHPIDLKQLWKSLSFHLSPKSMRSMLAFLYLSRSLEATSEADDLAIKMIRWQERTTEALL
jgi:hypothetical protein